MHCSAAALADCNKDDEFSDVPIPLFSRFRTVTVRDDNVMLCDCLKFECRGIPCADQGCVAELVHQSNGAEYKGFTHHDVTLRYRSDYMHLAHKSTTPHHIQMLFHRMQASDIEGPQLRVPIPDSIPILPPTPPRSALDRLKNYDKKHRLVSRGGHDVHNPLTFNCTRRQLRD